MSSLKRSVAMQGNECFSILAIRRPTSAAGCIPAPSAPARARCIRRFAAPLAGIPPGCVRIARGICWKTIQGFHTRPRSRLLSPFVATQASALRAPAASASGNHAVLSRMWRGINDGSDTRKGRLPVPRAEAAPANCIRSPAGPARGTSGGKYRHVQGAPRRDLTIPAVARVASLSQSVA